MSMTEEALLPRFAFDLITLNISVENGDGEIRTLDPLLARQVLSQLSYTPIPGTKDSLHSQWA